MATRAIRKTTLSLGLVNANVSIKNLARDSRQDSALHYGTLDGNKPVQRYLDETTGAIYEQGELLRGVYDDYKNGIGFHPVSKESVEAIDAACEIDGLNIDGFIPAADFPKNRVEKSYFLSPEGGPAAAKSLALVRDAMLADEVVGIGKCTLSNRQRTFAVYADGKSVVLVLLTFDADTAEREDEAQGALAGLETDASTLVLARQLVANLTGAASLSDYTDDSLAQREALVLAAAAGQTIEAPEIAALAPVIDLEAALLASIGASQPAAAAAPKRKAKSAAKIAA